MDVRVNRGAEIFSDHLLVIEKMRLLSATKLKIDELSKPQVRQLYQNRIKRCIRDEQIDLNNSTIDEKWQMYKQTLLSCAEEVCGRKQIIGERKRTACHFP